MGERRDGSGRGRNWKAGAADRSGRSRGMTHAREGHNVPDTTKIATTPIRKEVSETCQAAVNLNLNLGW